ncbi:hypothetical protein OH807_05310 [Kitasatospora sp. NBC_01560]|uniref:hypothetical protein n=1 Tax=Kitasatospora sp. NBC_01560 TaxID=2975965 RepID=UPI003868B629
MHLDDNDYWRRWLERLLAILAADPSDQPAWAGEHRVSAVAVADDVRFVLQLAEGMAERGTLEPEALQDLRAIDRIVGEAVTRDGGGRWADALASGAGWNEVRARARRILVARLGEWRLPLPRRTTPQDVHD